MLVNFVDFGGKGVGRGCELLTAIVFVTSGQSIWSILIPKQLWNRYGPPSIIVHAS